jgi:hypothetical protein
MKADLLFRQRIDYDDGAIVEMARSVACFTINLRLKYSLFYGRPGIREVGYDNERGKGITGISRVSKQPMRSARSNN